MKIALVLAGLIAISFSQKDITSEMVALHNKNRVRHRVGTLAPNSDLIRRARACAVRNANRGYIGHDCTQAKGLGENLCGGGAGVRRCFQLWYDEHKKYNYRKGGFSGATGHFTQVVWKGTTQIGCASAKSKGSAISCLYSPPGNYPNQFQKNVFQPR